MVTSNNMLIGLGAIVIAFFFLKKNGASVESIFRPDVSPSTPTENPELTGLKQILSQVQGIFKNAFKAPMLTKGLTTGGKTFPCRGPNCLGLAQARGTLTGFDPFTGRRVILGGSQKLQNIIGQGPSQFAFSQQRITQGNILKADFMKFIANLTTQINILQSKSV